jgi:hypothetical protein
MVPDGCGKSNIMLERIWLVTGINKAAVSLSIIAIPTAHACYVVKEETVQEDEPAPTVTKKDKHCLQSRSWTRWKLGQRIASPKFERNQACQYKPLQSHLSCQQEMDEVSNVIVLMEDGPPLDTFSSFCYTKE